MAAQHSKLDLEDRLEAEFEAEMATLSKSSDDLVAEHEKALGDESRRKSRRLLRW